MENVDAIAKVAGVDVLFVGPFDLAIAIGRPIVDGKMHEDVVKAIARVVAAAKKNGKHTGMFCVTGEQSRMFAAEGFDMISMAYDVEVITAYIGQQLQAAKS